jgi:hypothetical protein
MKSKLILTIEDKVIVSAKKYAHKNGKNLSHLIENYLRSVSIQQADEHSPSPKISKFRGVISLPDDFDYKTELHKAIAEKY